MCANLVGAARKCARESGSRAARNLKNIRAKFAQNLRLKIKFGADMAKRVSQMHYYGEERNSVKVPLKGHLYSSAAIW